MARAAVEAVWAVAGAAGEVQAAIRIARSTNNERLI
jgi:hypothetical protein